MPIRPPSSFNSFKRLATELAQVLVRGRTSETQFCAERQPSRNVGICTIEVGSPTAGKIRMLNSALPPIGQR